VTCPWCAWEGTPRELHAHLSERHPEAVQMGEREGRRFYAVSCPSCGAGYEQQVKPRSRDPDFVREFEQQIRLVAFDMLINHIMAEHATHGVEG
jgi:hypothetical protein